MTGRSADPRVVRYDEKRVERYLRSGAWSDVPTAERFHQAAVRHGDRTAVVDQHGSITYAELDLRTDQVAAALVEGGLAPGDPVLFQLGNSIATVVAWYAVLKAGAVPVATLAGHRSHEIGHVARQVGAVGHLVDATPGAKFDLVAFAREQAELTPSLRYLWTVHGAERDATRRLEDLGTGIDPATARRVVEGVQAGLDPRDIAVFQLSGGTTGSPKIIPRLHGEYWNNGLAWGLALGRTESTVAAHAAPLLHNAGVSCGLHATHALGGCLVLPPPVKDVALALMAAHQVDDTLFGHGMFGWILSEEYEAAAAHLRTVVLAGAKVPPEVFARVESFGARAAQTFGMGEGLFTLTPLTAPRELRATTVGPPLTADDEFRVLDPGSERELPDGEIGELACRGWYTIPGYFDAPEHNSRAFTSDGFYRTGDLAAVTVTADGSRYLSIEGRIKDIVNRGGEKINAEELEQLLHRHDAVLEAAVVAMPDPVLGERVCAYVVTTGAPLDVPALRRHLESLGVAKYKWPERVEVVGGLPRTQVGKVDKRALRDDIGAKLSAGTLSSR
ncbi:2,3-dihydroxybenzoate-AMP ligase [Lentzea fradiae]|uniref:2,3-dihydroxybenzoate-AMP ligase n=1 Tax=Lentzea fradiae TaxID=200378 RepID=A0A1G7LBK0_9PSEU|nr:AMP-binding protein [Lentzea fradiae]SDF46825.1 2,3-dihydroxybenzoate-AMP ligase [Lentzea fradiae]